MAKRNTTRSVKISELNEELNSWKIHATVSFEEKEVKTIKSGEHGEGGLRVFSVILQDKSGSIKGIAFNKFAERLSTKIRNKKKYCVSGADIRKAHTANNKTNHEFQLIFKGNAEFKDAVTKRVYHLDDDHENSDSSDSEAERRSVNLKPKKLNVVRKYRDQTASTKFDIVGVITKTKDVETKTNSRSNKQFFIKEISIRDQKEGVNLCLTSDLNEQFEDFDWSKGIVVCVKECSWKKLPDTSILTAPIGNVYRETEVTNKSAKCQIEKLQTWYATKKKPHRISPSRGPSVSKQETEEKPLDKRQAAMKRPFNEQEGPSSSKEKNPPQKKHRPSEEEKENAPPDVNISLPETRKEQPFKKHQSMKRQEEVTSTEHLMWKAENTSKLLKTSKVRANLGPKTARIKIGSGDENQIHYGTGFRVGSSYLFTAFHVVEDVLEKMWKTLYCNLNPHEREKVGLKEITKGDSVTKHLPETGPWSVSEMLKPLDKSRRERLNYIAKKMFTDVVCLYFDYVDEESQLSPIKVAYDITFVARSRDHDFVIMELAKDSHCPFPEKMWLQKYYIRNQSQKIILVGHPNGNVAKCDEYKIIDEDDFKEWKSNNITHFKEQDFNDDVIDEYESLQCSEKKIFFHATYNMGKGCSGGPILTHDLNPKVIGFYQSGLPVALYNNYRCEDAEKIKENKPDAFIEMGLSTEVIAEVLSTDEKFSYLLEDIF
ncbi:uncharacterized protein LOC134250100 isoform X2 [Saccostrea cucullata]|uniref:uncharacterized protein LOC134250100 isoform X2 n=1 Tax=Saccostrea cuccullata TaxID=36930 RepID=UPI002ED4682B